MCFTIRVLYLIWSHKLVHNSKIALCLDITHKNTEFTVFQSKCSTINSVLSHAGEAVIFCKKSRVGGKERRRLVGGEEHFRSQTSSAHYLSISHVSTNTVP